MLLTTSSNTHICSLPFLRMSSVFLGLLILQLQTASPVSSRECKVRHGVRRCHGRGNCSCRCSYGATDLIGQALRKAPRALTLQIARRCRNERQLESGRQLRVCAGTCATVHQRAGPLPAAWQQRQRYRVQSRSTGKLSHNAATTVPRRQTGQHS